MFAGQIKFSSIIDSLDPYLPDLLRLFVIGRLQIRCIVMFAIRTLALGVPSHPFGRGVEGFAAMGSDAGANSTHDRGVDADT